MTNLCKAAKDRKKELKSLFISWIWRYGYKKKSQTTVPLKPLFPSQNVEAILARSEQVMGICQGILNGEMISPALLPATALTATAVERLQVQQGIGIRIRIGSGFMGSLDTDSGRGGGKNYLPRPPSRRRSYRHRRRKPPGRAKLGRYFIVTPPPPSFVDPDPNPDWIRIRGGGGVPWIWIQEGAKNGPDKWIS